MSQPALVAIRLLADCPNGGGSIHELACRLGAGDSLAKSAQDLLAGPLRILVVIVTAFVVTRLVPRMARRLVGSLQLRTPLRRAGLVADNRAATIASVLA